LISFSERILKLQQIEELQKARKTCGVYELSGVIDPAKAGLSFVLSKDEDKSIVFITYSEARAKELVEDLSAYRDEVLHFPAKDLLFYGADIKSSDLSIKRMETLKSVIRGEKLAVVVTVDALMNKLVPKRVMDKHTFLLEEGGIFDPSDLTEKLLSFGYYRVPRVEHPGEFSVRGGIMDIFAVTKEEPVRIEFWDDEIDTIRWFDPESQRSDERTDSIRIFPAREAMIAQEDLKRGLAQIKEDAKKRIDALRKDMETEEAYRLMQELESIERGADDLADIPDFESYLPYFYEDAQSLLDYFDKENATLFVDEYPRVKKASEELFREFQSSMEYRLKKGYILEKQKNLIFSPEEIFEKFSVFSTTLLSTLSGRTEGVKVAESFSVNTKSVSSYNSNGELFLKELKDLEKRNYAVAVISPSASRAKRIADELNNEGLHAAYREGVLTDVSNGIILTTYGALRTGFSYPDAGFAMISESDIYGKKKKRHRKKFTGGEKIGNFNDLHVGDYVVHENHGVGIYRGVVKEEIDHVVRDYIQIEYAKNGKLYIPVTQLDLIQKYSAKEGAKPKLNSIGSPEWTTTKARVKAATEEIAQELVDLYAVRSNINGYSFSQDTPWQQEFEEAFPFEETDCQLSAIEDTKKDMESTKIMDRLICGDVGFGKTEVAIRAAFKAVQDGKQVAILAPTTILAQQHYHTFLERMKSYPVKVGLMCRLRTEAENKRTATEVKAGVVDIVIGTHRLLSKDVEYSDLGLLIIDEEQRFGVSHKETIKGLKKSVDVLSLSATPIPRTLHMSLVGIRDMSLLEEAPAERSPIQTYVMEYDEEMVREGIERELARGGQVYFVHNRVRDIADVTAKLRELCPDATIEYAHGKMSQQRIEDIMYEFVNGEIDVLVATTIIEIGLDIPNVNTIIIQDAENFGLSQLYQLRGRVGRSSRAAYAFLLYKRNKMLREEAEKRLSAIREFTELGSGFKIAMRDLEIRGAGNMLGEAQSGHMDAVGYDLYCKMLSDAVAHVKGEKVEETFETKMDIAIDAFISPNYIPDELQKIEIYKRIASLSSDEEAEDLKEELIDRFGDYPKSVENLFLISKLKAMAHKCYFTDIIMRGEQFTFIFYPDAKINGVGLMEVLKEYENYIDFFPKYDPPQLVYTPYKNSNDRKIQIMAMLETLLTRLTKSLIIS